MGRIAGPFAVLEAQTNSYTRAITAHVAFRAMRVALASIVPWSRAVALVYSLPWKGDQFLFTNLADSILAEWGSTRSIIVWAA